MRPRLTGPQAAPSPPGQFGEASAQAEAMARPFRLMFAVGGALTLAHLALPANGTSKDGLLVLAAGICFGLCALIWSAGRRLPAWSYQLFLTTASLLTAFIVYASGDSTSAYTSFFFWI